MTAILPSVTRRARLLFDVTFARRVDALNWSLDAETGQAATFLRTTAETATDRTGSTIYVAPRTPRFSWGALDFDDAAETVGLTVDGDALTYPFLKSLPLTLYVRFARGTSGVAGTIVEIGGLTGPRLVLSENPATGYTATYHNGVTSVSSSFTADILPGDLVELRVVLTGAVTLGYALSGSPEELATTSATIAMASAWNVSTLSLGSSLGGSLPTDHTFVRLAVGLGTLPMSAFRPAGRVGFSGPVAGIAMVFDQTSPGIYELADVPISPDLELVEMSAGVYEAVAVGTNPTADRLAAKRRPGHQVVVT